MSLSFPDGKRFAFSIFDDTDHATVDNVGPVYRLLASCGLRTTKSVWLYPPKGGFTGQCLQDPEYRAFILGLRDQGFEIALHGVGDGDYRRTDILRGLDEFKQIFGSDSLAYANHASNPSNIYWGAQRFERPLSDVYRLTRNLLRGTSAPTAGDDPSSPYFWGDVCKERIRYIRNLTFNGINTSSYDPLMPYPVRRKETYSNLWFSSSDGHTVSEFRDLISDENCEELERQGGVCIVYTHFGIGFVDAKGRIDPVFEERIRRLAKRPGWFVPVTPLLDHLAAARGTLADPGYVYRLRLDCRWAVDRIGKLLRYGR
jgi:hypothetical protein